MNYITFNYSVNNSLHVNVSVFKDIILEIVRDKKLNISLSKDPKIIHIPELNEYKICAWISLNGICSFTHEVKEFFKMFNEEINRIFNMPAPNIQLIISENENYKKNNKNSTFN